MTIKNYIGIDTSLSSTGMYIQLPNQELYFNYRNSAKDSKWHKVLSYIQYRNYELPETSEFSEEQFVKLKTYDAITDMIITDMVISCNPAETIVYTESYSYSSSVGPLIDLVTYATLLRSKIVRAGFANLIVVPPSSLKSATCLTVYGPGEGKKPSRNTLGIAGGRFQKPDMLQALYDFPIQNQIKSSLEYYKEDLMGRKSIPAPISDIVDAIWLVKSQV